MEIKIFEDGVVVRSYVFTDSVPLKSIQRCMEILQNKPEPGDILDRRDYIATTLWSDEDLRDCLAEEGYEDSPENISILKQSGDLVGLGDCQDESWAVIYGAIRENADHLKRKYPTLEKMESMFISVIELEEVTCSDLTTAFCELMEMGFNENQLLYFGFSGLDATKPLCFAATYDQHEKPEKVAYDLLLSIARWFFKHCCSESNAREILDAIGYDEELIEQAMA